MRRPAAVLLGILDSHIILTKRAASLKSFTGHICLPGGQQETEDLDDMVITATREFMEEVTFAGNITPALCMLPEYSIVSEQPVFPIVAKLTGTISGFNREEVEQILLLPLKNLSPGKFDINPHYPTIKHNKYIELSGEVIWGLTAHILYKFSLYYNSPLKEELC